MIFQASFYKSKKLLLIEDCEPVRASIKGMLQQIGFEDITTVNDAVQAMPLAVKDNFDFILADFDLGTGKDAVQFFAELSSKVTLRVGCCFILMSAEPRRLPVLGILNGAPDSFILKPFSYIELEKRMAKAWNNRVKLRKALLAIQLHDYKTAQSELDIIINAVNSSSLLALRIMAEVLLKEANYTAAINVYEQVSQQRDFSWARLGNAVAMLQSGELGAAETQLLLMLEQDDIRPEALEWLACLYLRQDNIALTTKQLSELLKLQPAHLAAQRVMGCVLLQQGQLDTAIKHWQKLVQLYRFSAFDDAEYYFSLTRLLLEQASSVSLTDFATVLKKASEALSSMPQKLLTEHTEPNVQILRARICVLQGNLLEAKQTLSQSASPDSSSTPEYIIDRARLAFALGDIKSADADLKWLAQFSTVKADLLAECQRLKAQYLQQREQQVRSQIRQWNQAGMEALQNGDAKQALALLRQAFMLMPCNAALVLNLFQTLSQLPFDRALKPMVKAAMLALELSTKSAANQQRLAQLLPQLSEAYLD